MIARHRHNLRLLVKFAAVGASGVLVNLLALIVVAQLGPTADLDVLGLPVGDFHVRWYHVYSTVAFLVANLWNFQLNRSWTFGSARFAGWLREYVPFLLVGLLGKTVGLLLLTLLMHPDSPFSLSWEVFDNSTGLRTRLYWAQLIVIVVVTPLSFVLNKIWTFNSVRRHHRTRSAARLTG